MRHRRPRFQVYYKFIRRELSQNSEQELSAFRILGFPYASRTELLGLRQHAFERAKVRGGVLALGSGSVSWKLTHYQIFSCQRTRTRLRARAFCPVYWFTCLLCTAW